MSRFPDSLIARKCWPRIDSGRRTHAARRLPGRHPRRRKRFGNAPADLDFWLESTGHRRNPGTTADLLAAGLYRASARTARNQQEVSR